MSFLYIRLQTRNTSIIKFGITNCLRSRHSQYKDDGWFAHTFMYSSRKEARDVEKELIKEFANASVSTSGEYLLTTELAGMLGIEFDDQRQQYRRVAKELRMFISECFQPDTIRDWEPTDAMPARRQCGCPDVDDVSRSEDGDVALEIHALWNSPDLRSTELEGIRFVSVFDVVTVVTKCTNPSMTISRIYEEYPELKDDVKFVQFHGQGQRRTPVMNSQAFIELVQVLPGKTAARFRRKGAAVLARYLRGDVTLIPEIAGNAANASAAAELFPAPSDHTNRLFRIQRLEAERHAGASIGDFGYQPCVYVLNARVNDCDVVKVGSTNDIVRRVGEHLQDLDIQSVYSVIPCDMAFKLERNVHDRLRPYQMKGVRGLELYQGVTAQHADTLVTGCAGELHAYLASKYGSPGVSEAQRMEHELRMKQMDVEATHAETKRLEMVLKLKEVGSQLATCS